MMGNVRIRGSRSLCKDLDTLRSTILGARVRERVVG